MINTHIGPLNADEDTVWTQHLITAPNTQEYATEVLTMIDDSTKTCLPGNPKSSLDLTGQEQHRGGNRCDICGQPSVNQEPRPRNLTLQLCSGCFWEMVNPLMGGKTEVMI